jgi:hypothetical protein
MMGQVGKYKASLEDDQVNSKDRRHVRQEEQREPKPETMPGRF